MPILAHKIRLDLNNKQRTFFNCCAGAVRFVFNWGLAEWNRQYSLGEKPSWIKLNRQFNAIKNTAFPWIRELPWKISNQALQDLGAAFTNFFRRIKEGAKKPGYPKRKKKGRAKPSFAIEARSLQLHEFKGNKFCYFSGNFLKIPKLGWIRIREMPRFPGKILSARFTKTADHWFVSFQIEVNEDHWIYPHSCETQAICGVDLGLNELAILNTGEKIKAPRILRRMEKRLQRLNKELHRRVKGRKNWCKTKAKLGKLHARITNIRKDAIHKLTTDLIKRFRFIGIEDLNVEGMLKNKQISKSITDASLYEIKRQFIYKTSLSGSTVIQADRWFPSSKRCSTCGFVKKDLSLSERSWVCTTCSTKHDRDVNAAKNLKQLAAAYAVTACCQESSGFVKLNDETKLSFGQELSSYVNQ